jgi:hypothetical protein
MDEAETLFPMLGMAIRVMNPGEPSTTYHWETEQEDFLVLAGEAILLIEGSGATGSSMGFRALSARGAPRVRGRRDWSVCAAVRWFSPVQHRRFCMLAEPDAMIVASLPLCTSQVRSGSGGRRWHGRRDGRMFAKREVSTWVRRDGVTRARPVVRRPPGRGSAVADRGGRVPRGGERRGELTERIL